MGKRAMSNKRGKTRSYTKGFVQTASLLTRRVSQVGERRGFAESRLLTRWTEIVGAEIASFVRPVKVTYAREGFGATLVVLCQGARGPEVEMQLPVIRERVNACYGYNAISRVRVTQTAATGFAEAKVPFEGKPRTAPVPDPVASKKLNGQLNEVSDSSLREALAALGENVLIRAKQTSDHQEGN